MAKGVFHFKAKLRARRLPIKIADLSKLLKALILTFFPGRRDRVPNSETKWESANILSLGSCLASNLLPLEMTPSPPARVIPNR